MHRYYLGKAVSYWKVSTRFILLVSPILQLLIWLSLGTEDFGIKKLGLFPRPRQVYAYYG